MNSETNQKADLIVEGENAWERETSKLFFFFFLLCAWGKKKKKKKLIALISSSWFIFYDTWNPVFTLQSLEYFWCTNKGSPEPEGEHEIKWGLELKTSPYDHCVPPQNDLEPLYRSHF